MSKLSHNHPYIDLSKKVCEISKPLQNISITHFTYMKNSKSGLQINLSSNPQWIDDYYNLDLSKSSQFEGDYDKYTDQYVLWSSQEGKQVILHGRDKFNTDYGITIVRKVKNAIEYYFFSGLAQNSHMHNFYINNLNLLERYILYFNELMFKDIHKLESKQINKNLKLPHKTTSLIHNLSASQISLNRINAYYAETKLGRLNLSHPGGNVVLSRRQTDCFRALFNCKTIVEISENVNLSSRTAEKYLEEIRRKLNCGSKAELYQNFYYLKDFV